MATNFMPGEWSIIGNRNPFLSGGIPGLGSLAGFGADFLGSKLGIQPNMLGSIGGLAGTMFGPLGSFAGGFLGNAVGDLFGMGGGKPSRPRSSYFYDFDADRAWLNQSKGLDEKTKAILRGIVEPIGQTAEGFLDKLGLDPTVPGFSFGNFQNRVGFLLPGDEWATNAGKGSKGAGKEYYGPNVWQVIGPNRYQNSYQGVRAFGTSKGERTAMPTIDAFREASNAALDALVLPAIQQAGLTNADVFGKFGLPTELEALKGALPNLNFGDDFSLTNPFQFKATDLLSLYNQPTGQTPGTMPGTMPSAPPMGTNANNLMNLYTQMRPRMQSSSWQNQPSYYSRWQ